MSEMYDSGYVIHYPDGSYSLERNIPTITMSDEDITHTLKDGETLQNIAFRYYGDSGKWYIIAEANNIINPFKDLVPGLQLKIPAYGIQE